MARHEADREDLLAEATALSPRAEWRWNDLIVTAGLRRDGSLSIYFDGEPMYQFDPQGRLRRALVDGLLYRTQGDHLAALRRVRSDVETTLARRDLSSSESLEFLQSMQHWLDRFLTSLENQGAVVTRIAPQSARVDTLLAAIERAARLGELAPGIQTRP